MIRPDFFLTRFLCIWHIIRGQWIPSHPISNLLSAAYTICDTFKGGHCIMYQYGLVHPVLSLKEFGVKGSIILRSGVGACPKASINPASAGNRARAFSTDNTATFPNKPSRTFNSSQQRRLFNRRRVNFKHLRLFKRKELLSEFRALTSVPYKTKRILNSRFDELLAGLLRDAKGLK